MHVRIYGPNGLLNVNLGGKQSLRERALNGGKLWGIGAALVESWKRKGWGFARAGEERGKLSRGFASKMEEERSEGGEDSSSSQLLLQNHERAENGEEEGNELGAGLLR